MEPHSTSGDRSIDPRLGIRWELIYAVAIPRTLRPLKELGLEPTEP